VVTGQVNGNSASGQSLTLTGPGDFYLGQIQRTSFPSGSVTVNQVHDVRRYRAPGFHFRVFQGTSYVGGLTRANRAA